MELQNDYGFVILNAGEYAAPVPRMVVGHGPDRSVTHCESLDEFRQALTEIPEGASIHRYEKCCVPLSAGISEAYLSELEEIVRGLGLHLSEEAYITCTCP